MTLSKECLVRFAEECALRHFHTLPTEICLEKAVDFIEKIEVPSRVFKVKNRQEQLLFVIKAYPAARFDSTMIKHLTSSQGLLRRLNLVHTLLPSPLMVDERLEDHPGHYLIAFAAVAGSSLCLYLENKNHAVLQKALQKVALSLAELHLKQLNPLHERATAYTLQEQHALRFFHKWMQHAPTALPLKVEVVTQKFYELRTHMLASPSFTGAIHGDAMLHHFFYHTEKEELALIDWDRFTFAILAAENLGGPIAYDYAFVVNSLWQLGLYAGWEQRDLGCLEKEFTEPYRAQMGKFFPSAASICYYSFIYCLKKACLTSKRLTLFSQQTAISIKLNRTLSYLVNAL